MPNDARDARADALPVPLGWGAGHDGVDGFLDGPVLWLTGGAALLLWTAVSLVLTA